MGWLACLCLFVVHNILVVQINSQETVPNSIPHYLQECYSDPTLRDRALRLPSTMGTLISLLQKAERNEHTEKLTSYVGGVLDARVMSYSLLHRFRLDGIQRMPNMPNYDKISNTNVTNGLEGVIPYAAIGWQFNRYKILLGELIPGNAVLFPNSTLDSHEKCALHFMLSSTIDRRERGDEGVTCRGVPIVKPSRTLKFSDCPLEDGVVAVHSPYSSRSDTISPGTVIAGIAAALQYQEVPVAKLMKLNDNNAVINAHGGDSSFQNSDDLPPVSNIWAATLAGDLAEVAVFQGPYKMKIPEKERESVSLDITVGVDGWWGGGPNISSTDYLNAIDSRLGRWYYLMRSTDLQMTDAEIRGGIDGILLGSEALKWNSDVKGRLRLSQILEMYYTEKGMAAYGDPNLKWCNRIEKFAHGFGAGNGNPNAENMQILHDQTMSFAKIFYDNVQTAQYDINLLQDFVRVAVQKFERYLTHDIDYQHCANGYYGRDEQLPGYPYVDLYIVTDGSWIGHNLTTLMAYLAEECDVSLFGSRMSVMNGRTSKWITDFAMSTAQVVLNITNEIVSPSYKVLLPGLDIVVNLVKLNEKINDKQRNDRIRNIIKGIRPQVVVFLAHRSLILGADLERMKQAADKFRADNPDVHMIFASVDSAIGDEDPFSKLGGQFVKTTGSRPSDVVPSVLSALRLVPRRMISYSCDQKKTKRLGPPTTIHGGTYGHLELEDYLSPGDAHVYRLHPMYFKKSQEAKIVFEGSGYGEVSICMTRHRPDEPRSIMKASCQQLTSGSAEFQFHDPCPGGQPYNHGCLPIYFELNVTKTFGRCTEDDCRFPDQVRFSVWQQNVKCSGATALTVPILLLAILLLWTTTS
ncbi:uncharacterized protein LOC124154541 [Ischnura elegans]|uniref:uncharacterized protein LOC124154541 n=1 Tax=Ischnura elegans TaxID=197161 RepID=UPI001ED893DC|nr:uncharacterized protein LOC124154541 [Ischnura elegans]